MAHKLLICDDDGDILRSLDLIFTSEGFTVLKAEDGLEALEVMQLNRPDLIILDVMMPKLDGINALLKLRQQYNIPVILLSAKSEIEDKVLGLNAGADDYMTKPFNPFELVARVKSHLRRASDFSRNFVVHQEGIYTTGGIRLNDQGKEVEVDGNLISLTPNEYGILFFLIQHKGRVFTSNQIYEAVWQEEAFDIKKVVSLHISHLREKIEIDPKNPDYLVSIYGMGYKLTDIKEGGQNNNGIQ
ncbi:MAG: response regulator transcription factor [Clostridiaceae bacterium]